MHDEYDAGCIFLFKEFLVLMQESNIRSQLDAGHAQPQLDSTGPGVVRARMDVVLPRLLARTRTERKVLEVVGDELSVDSVLHHPDDLPHVADVLDHYTTRGVFRPRTSAERMELLQHHFILSFGDRVLGGFSLVPQSQRWVELSALWRGHSSGDIGQHLLREAQREASRAPRDIYALSSNGHSTLFTQSGFRDHGRLSTCIASFADPPDHLRHYDTTSRDPHVFTYLVQSS